MDWLFLHAALGGPVDDSIAIVTALGDLRLKDSHTSDRSPMIYPHLSIWMFQGRSICRPLREDIYLVWFSSRCVVGDVRSASFKQIFPGLYLYSLSVCIDPAQHLRMADAGINGDDLDRDMYCR